MANYLLAGLVVNIQNRYPFLEKQCAAFRCPEDLTPDITLFASDAELAQEARNVGSRFSPGYVESVCIYRKLCLQMPAFSGLFLHSSVIRVEDRGIAFLAPSGTGKTTHTTLWQQLLGENMRIINGDKPIVRFLHNDPVAFGTPWAGKEGLYEKDLVKLTDLCFLSRAAENTCTPLRPEDALQSIANQVILPKEAQGMVQTLDLLDRLLRSCRLWRICCNTDISAAEIAYNTIIKTDL